MQETATTKSQTAAPRSTAGGGAVCVAAFLVAAVVLNAPAMLRSTENLPFDAAVRRPAIAVLNPIARLSHALRLDALRAAAEALERKYLE